MIWLLAGIVAVVAVIGGVLVSKALLVLLVLALVLALMGASSRAGGP
jgi:hypothetical protein